MRARMIFSFLFSSHLLPIVGRRNQNIPFTLYRAEEGDRAEGQWLGDDVDNGGDEDGEELPHGVGMLARVGTS